MSDQPVVPSFGLIAVTATGGFAAVSWTYWYGHVVPTVLSAFVNDAICLATSPGQYSPTYGACFLSRATAALNCSSLSWYGLSIPRSGCVALR